MEFNASQLGENPGRLIVYYSEWFWFFIVNHRYSSTHFHLVINKKTSFLAIYYFNKSKKKVIVSLGIMWNRNRSQYS